MAPHGAFFTPMLPPYFLVGRAQALSEGFWEHVIGCSGHSIAPDNKNYLILLQPLNNAARKPSS